MKKVITDIEGLKERVNTDGYANSTRDRVFAAIDAFTMNMPDTDRRAMIDAALANAPDNTTAVIQAFTAVIQAVKKGKTSNA